MFVQLYTELDTLPLSTSLLYTPVSDAMDKYTQT